MSNSGVWTWVLATILCDFCYYWLHRMGHERAVLWAAHVAHHQSEDYNLSTALRQTSTGFLLSWMFYIPMFALGVPGEVVVTVGSLNLIYQFWVHTEHVGKLGWYEGIFVTPSNHRVHHAQNAQYLDRNYGGLFIVWDRMFGTFQEELDTEAPVYGIRGPLRSFNPFRALTHIYADMLRDSWHTKRWQDKGKVWVARTGWRPADREPANTQGKPDLSEFVRFDPPKTLAWGIYALLQLLASAVLCGFLQSGVATGYWMNAGLVLAMLLTTMTTATWLETTPSGTALSLDAARIVVLGLCLTTVPDQALFVKAAAVYLGFNAVFAIGLYYSRDAGTTDVSLGTV